ncbi:MAG: hypothetical protein Kow00108_03220 [Calditrichia bacterium]
MRISFIFSLLFLFFYQALGQFPVKRDDFIGNQRRGWWRWYNDIDQAFPDVNSGIVYFNLVNPEAGVMHDVAFWDGVNLYDNNSKWVARMRVRTLTPHLPGSRGWGFWRTEPQHSSTMHAAWFFEETDSSMYADYDPTDEIWAILSHTSIFPSGVTEIPLTGVDNSQWHTYRIDWDYPDSVSYYIDGVFMHKETVNVPSYEMAFHIWVDNMVYDRDDARNIKYRNWTGNNAIVLDFVEIIQNPQPAEVEKSSGIIKLHTEPKEVGSGLSQYLWKTYDFDLAETGKTFFLVTARCENYPAEYTSDDDDIRLVIDGNDLGWDTANSLNGDVLQDQSHTLVYSTILNAGNHTLELYGDVTPILFDVTVLSSPSGNLLVDQIENFTPQSPLSNEMMKEYQFYSVQDSLVIYVSASVDEDITPDGYGSYWFQYSEAEDDDIKLVVNGVDYGYSGEYFLDGNSLFGETGVILVTVPVNEGTQTVQIFGNNTPTLHRVVVFGKQGDVSLPVTLKSFSASVEDNNMVLLKWETEAEFDMAGYNIYRRFLNQIQKVNQTLIEALNSSSRQIYQLTDHPEFVPEGEVITYFLESIDVFGARELLDSVRVSLQSTPAVSENFFTISSHLISSGRLEMEFQLTEGSDIELDVFNILGQKEGTIRIGSLNSGSSRISVNLMNQNIHWKSGLYFLVPKSDKKLYLPAQKMIFVQ